MGSLVLPESGVVYADTQILIYTIEKIAPYSDLLTPLWEASGRRKVVVATSELSVLEALVGPLKSGDERLAYIYEEFLNGTEIRLAPIDREILLEAARLRAKTSLRTPDAIHAATALSLGCSLFLTNDSTFHSLDILPVKLLSTLTAADQS